MGNHVLLIEDEPNIREAMRFILSRDGWDVSIHSDGATSLDVIQTTSPDAVILDVMLPNRSGYEILKDVRAVAGLERLPILMLTARGQTKDREMALAAGASDYMTKPFANEDVLTRLRALVARAAV